MGELAGPASLRVLARIGIIGDGGKDATRHWARLGIAMDERDVEQAAHAVTKKRIDIVVAVHAPGLALHVGKRAHEERAGRIVLAVMSLANRVDDAGDEQVGDDRGKQRARTKHDEVGFSDDA